MQIPFLRSVSGGHRQGVSQCRGIWALGWKSAQIEIAGTWVCATLTLG